MPDPIIYRGSQEVKEVFTGSVLTAVEFITRIYINDEPIIIQLMHELTENEQIVVKNWSPDNIAIDTEFVKRAQKAANLEYKVYQAIKTYFEALP